MGRNAMARVRSRFDIEVVIEKWQKVIQEILAGTPATGASRSTSTLTVSQLNA
jgi:hypothetical protein